MIWDLKVTFDRGSLSPSKDEKLVLSVNNSCWEENNLLATTHRLWSQYHQKIWALPTWTGKPLDYRKSKKHYSPCYQNKHAKMNKLMGIYEVIQWQVDFLNSSYIKWRFQGQLLSHSHITIKKFPCFYMENFIFLLLGLEGDNEKLRGRGNDVQRVEDEDSVNVERIYHNTSEYLSWKEMRNGEGVN